MAEEEARRMFAKRLRERRQEQKLTQTELASRAGLTGSAISQFESGDRDPSFSSLVKIAHALEVSPSYLSGLEEYDVEPEIRAFYREHKELSDKDRKTLQLLAAQLKAQARQEEGKG